MSVPRQLGSAALPEALLELAEGASQIVWSEVVPTVFYYISTTDFALRSRNVHTSQSFTLHRFPTPAPGECRTEVLVYVVPFGDVLHRSRAADVVIASTGLILGVDLSRAEPVVSQHATSAAFDVSPEGAPLCSLHWVTESVGGPRAASEAESVAQGRRLRPSYLDAMRRELEALERDSDSFQSKLARQPPPDPAHALARNMLLYPYGSDAPPEPQGDSAQEEPPQSPKLITQGPDAPWVAALVYVATDHRGAHCVALHLAPFPPQKEGHGGPAGVLAAAVRDAAVDLRMLDKVHDHTEVASRAVRHRLPDTQPASCVGTLVTRHGAACVVGSAGGSYCLYDSSKREFFYVDAARSGTGMADDEESQNTDGVEVRTEAERGGAGELPLPPTVQRGAPSDCVVTAADRGLYFALFGSSVEVYRLPVGADTLTPAFREMRLDADDGPASGCVHPLHPHLLVFTRDGMLCWFDLRTRFCGVVGPLRLTVQEVAQKRADGDLPGPDSGSQADAPSGPQVLRFSPDGKLLLRHNLLYGTCAVYAWADIAPRLRKLQSKVCIDCTPVAVPGCLAKRCVRREELRAFLAQQHSAEVPVQRLFHQLAALCSAILSGTISPNFRDADGRTPMHHAATLSSCSDPLRARDACAALLWLLRRGGSLYCADSVLVRPLDIAVMPAYTATRPVAAPALGVIRGFREEQESGKRNKLEVPVIAELGEHCDQVCCSAVSDAVLYFASAARGEVVALNIEREFSTPIHSYPGVVRLTVFPHSDTLHEGRRDRDYLLLSDGALISVHWVHGAAQAPVVEIRRTALRAEVQPGVPCGFCLAVTAVHRRPDAGPSEDYPLGIVGSVVRLVHDFSTSREATELRVIRLSSCMLPRVEGAISMLEFLGRAIDAGWCADANQPGGAHTSITLHSEVLPGQMAATSAPDDPEGALVCVFERPQEDGGAVGYWYQKGMLLPIMAHNLEHEGGTAGIALATPKSGLPQLAARFSRAVDLLPLPKPAPGASQATEVSPSFQLPGGDQWAEMTGGGFHPHRPELLCIFREGELLVHDCGAEQTRSVARLSLSDLELRRKAADGDGTEDDRVSGAQVMSFSANGVYLTRYNSFYNNFCVYAWADVERAGRKCGVQDWVALLNTSVDPTALQRRPPRRMALRGSLKRVTTKRLTLREKQEEADTLCGAIEAKMVSANFRDADGKTALHITCDIAHLLKPADVVHRVHWLLEQGATLYATDLDSCRPFDLLSVGGSGRAHFLTAVRQFEQRYFSASTVDRPLECSRCFNLHVSQIAPSATGTDVVYAMCSDADGPAADCRVAGAGCGWRLMCIDIGRNRVDELAAGPALSGWQRACMLVVPYQPFLHADEPVDYLLLNTGLLLAVRRTPSGSAAAEYHTEVRFSAGVAASSASGPRHPGTCCGAALMWVPAGALPPSSPKEGDGEHEEEGWDDMIGALCIATAGPGGAGVLRTLRLPRVEYAESTLGRHLCMLLRLASPVDEPFPFDPTADGPQNDVRITSVWRVSGGEFIAALPGRDPRVLSHRGSAKDLMLGLSDPSLASGDCAMACYKGADTWVCFPHKSGAGVAVHSLVPNAPLQTALVELWRSGDPVSDSTDAPGACFHPDAQQLIMLLDGELICYHPDTGNTVAVRRVELSDAEVARRVADGDGDSRDLVGEQALMFTGSGQYLCRLNLLYGILQLYDWSGPDEALQGWAVDCVQRRNATHLCGLCQTDPNAQPVPRLVSCLQPERRGNALRKEGLRGLCARLSSAHGDAGAQRACLLRLLASILQGIVGPNYADSDGRSALHLAMQLADQTPVEELNATMSFLMQMGACLYLCDKSGNIPTDLLSKPGLKPGAPCAPRLALDPVLEYHIRHFDIPPEMAARDPTGMTVVLSSFPAPAPVTEVPLCVSQIVPSPVVGALFYCVAEHEGSAFVYACAAGGGVAPYVIYETTELTASSMRVACLPYHPSVSNDRDSGRVLHDFVMVCDGMLLDVEVQVPAGLAPSIHSVRTAESRLHFQVHRGFAEGFAAAAAWAEPEGREARGWLCRVLTTAGERRFEARALTVPREDPGSEEMSARLDTVLAALQAGEVLVDCYLPQGATAVGMTAAGGLFLMQATHSAPLLWRPGDDDIRPITCQARGRGAPTTGSATVHDGEVYYAATSRAVEVFSLSRVRECSVLRLDDGEELPVGGCFHPVHGYLYVFTKDESLLLADLRQHTVKVVCQIRKGPREEEKSIASQVTSVNLLQFTADGSHLVRLNAYQEIASVYRWADFTDLLGRINAEADVINNAVFLPPVLAGTEVSTIYQEVCKRLQIRADAPSPKPPP
eukprot:TRINITY_DN838_c0_g1_i1.p1 TRINITY_DN838_c0_g1~~TRINITY_DN838_c0_g1_i1.p1  ORF type:complete len:2636 (+),score=772.35 TRINITY_DN838_c0_g1_i1:946-7908(+)